MASTIEGGCQCGAVRYRIAEVDPVTVALCHCRSCRRAHAAPAVGWVMYLEAQVEFTAANPAVYESSPGVRRSFCSKCGTPVCFTADFLPGFIDLPIGSLDKPEDMPPMYHFWDSMRLPWMKLDDGLPRHPELPPFE